MPGTVLQFRLGVKTAGFNKDVGGIRGDAANSIFDSLDGIFDTFRAHGVVEVDLQGNQNAIRPALKRE